MTRRADGPDARYNGKPCRHGHGTMRYRADDRCVECIKIKTARQERMRRIVGRRTPEHRHGLMSALSGHGEADRVPPLTDFRGQR